LGILVFSMKATINERLSRWTTRFTPLRSESPPHPRTRRIFSWVLITGGLGLLILAIAAYGWITLEQHRLSARSQAQNLATSLAREAHDVRDAGMTMLLIPKINLQAAILDGAGTRSLLLAPGHLFNTAWPGDPGNAVIAGHRDTFFRRLDELAPGDAIIVRRAAREYRYIVSETSIVAPNNIAVTYATEDTRLTLITCYPISYIGPAPKRLVVVGKLQPPQSAPLVSAAITPGK
jgi:sortase A